MRRLAQNARRDCPPLAAVEAMLLDDSESSIRLCGPALHLFLCDLTIPPLSYRPHGVGAPRRHISGKLVEQLNSDPKMTNLLTSGWSEDGLPVVVRNVLNQSQATKQGNLVNGNPDGPRRESDKSRCQCSHCDIGDTGSWRGGGRRMGAWWSELQLS